VDILLAFFHGLGGAIGWPSVVYILFGTLLGLTLGIIPGIGGITGLTLLLPLAFVLPFEYAIAMMMAMLAVTSTGDTIPAVLLGVPGTSAAAATIVDGYPMSKKGEAARALGAAYIASPLGGLIGAVVIVLSIPILRPIMLAFGPPEIFLLAMWGLTMLGILGGRRPLRGWAGGSLGVLLATVGRDPGHAYPRYTFGLISLEEGFPLVAVALGLFAIAELIDLARRGQTIAKVEISKSLLRDQLQGMQDALRNWWLVVRGSIIGVWIGFLPGLGGNVADWIAYGHARQTCKNTEGFGEGDVRGVIAPESANNSVRGGELIPTMAFGVPGAAPMAIVFGALLIVGIHPGAQMLTTHINLTMRMVWSLILANMLGAAICIFFTRYLARIAFMPGNLLVGLIIPIIVLSVFSSTADSFHIITLFLFGGLGYFMKEFDWPRPPLLVGFVLGTIIERNFVNSVRLFGLAWFLRPLSLGLLIMIIISVLYGSYLGRKLPPVRGMAEEFLEKSKMVSLLAFEIFLFALMLFTSVQALTWRFETALMPLAMSVSGCLFMLFILGRDVYFFRSWKQYIIEGSRVDTESVREPFRMRMRRGILMLGSILLIQFCAELVWLQVVIPLSAILYMRLIGGPKTRWRNMAIVVMILLGLVYGVYDSLIHVPWPTPLVSQLFADFF